MVALAPARGRCYGHDGRVLRRVDRSPRSRARAFDSVCPIAELKPDMRNRLSNAVLRNLGAANCPLNFALIDCCVRAGKERINSPFALSTHNEQTSHSHTTVPDNEQ
jgi:hypothetical protein